ncbi:uncharacterized protein LOC116416126 [Nasonia vitripennis]|uniref:Uncharacterized protein n=1 Tax=Nasonia vitripennis TaxID=7425 RepID=A0A7M7Q151_NASVI|nr:uncharacterized protein LOC116416126 [Nasonia vitripennis]
MLVSSSKISHWTFWTFNRRCSTQNSLLLRKEFNKLENVYSASNSGYCVTDKIVQELDKSFLAPDKNNGVHNCCDQHNVEKGYLCFEHLEGFDIQTLKAAMHFCLPTRAIIQSFHNLCQNNDLYVKTCVGQQRLYKFSRGLHFTLQVYCSFFIRFGNH